MAVLVLNFGGQFAHLIARRIRELGVYSEILSADCTLDEIRKLNPTGIVLSGGPASVLEQDSPRCDPKVFALGIPILGICYGHQLMGQELGGKVSPGSKKEFGRAELNAHESPLFSKIAGSQSVWFSHGDHVSELPKGFVVTASTGTCPIAGMQDEKRKLYGVQFHPEVAHTPNGRAILANFIFGICGEEKTWSVGKQLPKLAAELKERVGSEKVVIGISGGVDSLVAATLLQQSIGSQLHCVFIDTGLLRKVEGPQVMEYLKKQGFTHLHHIDASKDFLSQLTGVIDPEEKRKRIGHTFIRVFERAARELEQEHHIRFLAQGTIYPDRIESAQAGKHAHKIKSHHNLTLPDDLKFEIVEPLKEFYKDEVRELGKELGLPHELIWRHPFPGPGLAIRVLGEVNEERLRILREADAIFIHELKASGWYEKVWQAFAALLPVKSVGVMGDARTYDYIIALRSVDSVDGMTADWSKLPPEVLERASSRIVNEVRGVNRVLYDISQKPPSTVEYE